VQSQPPPYASSYGTAVVHHNRAPYPSAYPGPNVWTTGPMTPVPSPESGSQYEAWSPYRKATSPLNMAHPSSSGSTSLAPTPTHLHHLSREISKDELEMAESLRRLNQGHDYYALRTATLSHAQQPLALSVEVQSNGLATLANSVSLTLPPGSIIGTSALMPGQVCR
jgi:hypothetical protein